MRMSLGTILTQGTFLYRGMFLRHRTFLSRIALSALVSLPAVAWARLHDFPVTESTTVHSPLQLDSYRDVRTASLLDIDSLLDNGRRTSNVGIEVSLSPPQFQPQTQPVNLLDFSGAPWNGPTARADSRCLPNFLAARPKLEPGVETSSSTTAGLASLSYRELCRQPLVMADMEQAMDCQPIAECEPQASDLEQPSSSVAELKEPRQNGSKVPAELLLAALPFCDSLSGLTQYSLLNELFGDFSAINTLDAPTLDAPTLDAPTLDATVQSVEGSAETPSSDYVCVEAPEFADVSKAFCVPTSETQQSSVLSTKLAPIGTEFYQPLFVVWKLEGKEFIVPSHQVSLWNYVPDFNSSENIENVNSEVVSMATEGQTERLRMLVADGLENAARKLLELATQIRNGSGQGDPVEQMAQAQVDEPLK